MKRSNRLAALIAALLSPAWLAAVSGLAMVPAVLAQKEPRAAANLPIKTITLYRSGVGYFQRHGMVDSGDRVQLRFATDQINDMLKSMVIIDPQQALESVSYGSKEPLARQLASFGVNLSDEPSLGTILGRLRGARVRFVTPDGQVAGAILGGETREQAQGNAQKPIGIPFVNVVTESGIRSVNLTSIASVEIEDKALNAELMKALAALGDHSADRVKTVDLAFAGKGARDVAVAYVNEMPVWKTSYRLVLPESPVGKDPKKQGGQPTIQGWAIVENTTDEDWEGVKLGLVAGRPVSFQMDLYEPLHIERPMVAVPTVPGALPRMYAESAGFEVAEKLKDLAAGKAGDYSDVGRIDLRRALQSARGGGGGRSPFREQGNDDRSGVPAISAEQMTKYAAAAQAQAGETGEVFEYTLKSPVSIARQHSAMLPILASAIDGRRVSIYNRADGLEHPMRGVEVTNTTGLQLIPGPISVFDGAAYAGDAQIGHITTGDKRLLAYAVDLEVAAVVKEDTTGTVNSIKIAGGMIQQTSKQVHRVAYAFANKDAKRGRTLLVEQAKDTGWELTEPEKPAEETQELYRFEATLAPSESGKIDVVQERVDVQRFQISDFNIGTLVGYAKSGKASQAVVDAVKRAADMQGAINDTAARIARLEEERKGIDQDQSRIRQNMQSGLSKDTDIYRRYLTKFNDQETRLEAIRDEDAKERATLKTQQDELGAYVRGLRVE